MGVLQVSLPANVQTEIEQIGEILSSSIAAITNSSNDIRDILNSVRVALITVSILMLTSLQFLVSFLQFLGYISLSTRTMTLECSLCTFISKNYLNLFLFRSRMILGWILVTDDSGTFIW
ncbi:unnamed protein product [Brassica oleracea var. botrytis]